MHVALGVEYNGRAYNGFQRQKDVVSIQGALERAISTVAAEEISIICAGRTDAGVHATGQVVSFDCSKVRSMQAWTLGVNANLPPDIAITWAQEMPADFHARFSAVGKRYDYYCSYDIKNPFNYKYRNLLTKKLDIEAMKNASKVFLGSHDFTSFASSKIDPRKPRVKTISNIEIIEEGMDVHFIFEGTGFLRYQVRMMTGTLIAVGQHKIGVDDVQRMLDAKDKSACRYNASSCGLYLVEVKYNETN